MSVVKKKHKKEKYELSVKNKKTETVLNYTL